MRVLVTGGTGFQGSNLAKALLSRGDEVTILNTLSCTSAANIARFGLRDARVVWGSITDPEVVHKTIREHDLVFHLAANIHVDESRERPRDYFETNVIGTLNVAEACRRFYIPLFHVSSCEVYGNQQGTLTEESPMMPASPYGASKAGADNLVYSYGKAYGMRVLIVRPGNVFGFGQRGGSRGAMIPRFAERAMTGENIVIYGDGSQRRDFVYVKDLVRACLFLAERLMADDVQSPSVWNVATGRGVIVKSIAERIVAFINSDSEIVAGDPRPGEVAAFMLDSSKLLGRGFSWEWSFEEGLQDYLLKVTHTYV